MTAVTAQQSAPGGGGLGARVAPLRRRLQTEAGGAGLLLAATLAALLWVKLPFGGSSRLRAALCAPGSSGRRVSEPPDTGTGQQSWRGHVQPVANTSAPTENRPVRPGPGRRMWLLAVNLTARVLVPVWWPMGCVRCSSSSSVDVASRT